MKLNTKALKRALVINDMSCFGKCSLTVSLPIISAYGVECVPLPTAILSTHTGGFQEFTILDMSQEIEKITNHWQKIGLEFDCIYTGYFSKLEQIDFAINFIKNNKKENTIVLVDPVLGDNGKLYTGFNEGFVTKMQKLIEIADIITPNLTEAEFLTGHLGKNAEEILQKLNAPKTVITGIKKDGKIGYLAKDNEKIFSIQKKFYDIMLHGSGDVFASALVGEYLSCENFEKAVTAASEFCEKAVEITAKECPDFNYGLMFEKVLSERAKNGNF